MGIDDHGIVGQRREQKLKWNHRLQWWCSTVFLLIYSCIELGMIVILIVHGG